MKRLPTDLKILNAIYEQYYETFTSFNEEHKTRNSKVYVPIDIKPIAESLGVDGDIVFGRLYYHLDKKYAYRKENAVKVPFFEKNFNNEKHIINFPLMASVLADLRDQEIKYLKTTKIASFSVIISILAVLISILSWLVPAFFS